jgi:hypothetical protein
LGGRNAFKPLIEGWENFLEIISKKKVRRLADFFCTAGINSEVKKRIPFFRDNSLAAFEFSAIPFMWLML